MASTYSPTKLQYMTTGENDGTWGDITNQNYTALTDLVIGLGTVTFASADQVLTLTDTNAFQVARCYSLGLAGPTGGVQRNLTVPTILKTYHISNNCADPVNVKTAAGAGVVVPAGRSVILFCDGAGIYEQMNYSSGFLAAGFTSTGNITTQSLYWNAATGLLNGDATVNNLYLSVANSSVLQCNKATGNIDWYVSGVSNFNVAGGTGDFGIRGNVFTRGTTIALGASSVYQLTTDGANNNILFDSRTPLAYFQYRLASQLLQYVSNGVSNMTLDASGNMVVRGSLNATSLILPSNVLGGNVLLDNTVPGSKLVDGSVTYGKLAAASVDNSKWVPGTYFGATNGAGLALFNGVSTGAANLRWILTQNSGEAAGNVGNDLFINCYDNNGNYLATPFGITRASGTVSTGNLNANGGITAQSNIQALASLFFGTPSGNQYLNADATSSVLVFNPNCYLSYAKASGILGYVVNSVSHFSIDGTNGAVNCGFITANGANFSGGDVACNTVHAGNWIYATAGFAAGPGALARFNSDGSTFTQLYWNFNSPAYDQYSWGTGLFQKVVNSSVIYSIDVNGSSNQKGTLTCANQFAMNITGAGGGSYVVNVDGVVRYQWAYNTNGTFGLNIYSAAGAYQTTPYTIDLASFSFQMGASTAIYMSYPGSAYGGGANAINIAGANPGILFYVNGGSNRVSIGQYTAATSALEITQATGTAPNFRFECISGIGWAQTAWSVISDRNLKFDIEPVTGGLDLLASLTPYTYMTAATRQDVTDRVGNASAGIMVQDLIGTPMERLVLYSPDDIITGEPGPLGFNFVGLTAWYIAAFKEVKTELDATKATLAQVLARLDALEAK